MKGSVKIYFTDEICEAAAESEDEPDDAVRCVQVVNDHGEEDSEALDGSSLQEIQDEPAEDDHPSIPAIFRFVIVFHIARSVSSSLLPLPSGINKFTENYKFIATRLMLYRRGPTGGGGGGQLPL